METIEGPRRLPDFSTPEPEGLKTPPPEINWSVVETPYRLITALTPYNEYIDYRITAAINGWVPLSPTVSHVIEKRNKAQNIIVLNGILSAEELKKKQAEEKRGARHKKDGARRRVETDLGVINKGDARLRIAGRAEFLAQEKARKLAVWEAEVEKLSSYRWGFTARAAARSQNK